MMKGLAELRRVSLAIGTLFLVSGCGLDGLLGSDGSRVNVVLSGDGGALANVVQDSANAWADRGNDDDDDDKIKGRGFLRFESATLVVSSVLARTLDGELVDLDLDLPVDVDVVRLDGGRQLLLPGGFLPTGVYDQVIVVITAVQGETRDGTLVTIDPPGGGWTAVIPICQLEVLDGETTTLELALNARSSFFEVGNWWSFHPRFRSKVDCD